MANRGGLAVYVTSHGFGHLNRTVAVLNRVPDDIPLVVRCHESLFGGWEERLTRPARFEAHVCDSGAVNPPGDSAATDGPATLALAAEVHAEAMLRIDADVQTLRDEGSAAVLCDAPAVPLVAAKRAGVPGFLLGNFTWSEIYEPHARKLGAPAIAFVDELKAAYRHATAVFRTEPALTMKGFAPVIDVGLVVNPGRDRRAELLDLLGLSRNDKLVYFYVGRYGQGGMGWDRMASLRDVHFVGFHPADGGSPPNLHVIRPSEWNGADLARSCHAMVAKAGYGTATEAMAAGTPFIYPPRVGFAEHRALGRVMRQWGGGLPASSRDFADMRIEPLLRKAFAMTPGPAPYPIDGAQTVADHLTAVCRKGAPIA